MLFRGFKKCLMSKDLAEIVIVSSVVAQHPLKIFALSDNP